MEAISYWISQIALLVSGYIFVHTIERRESSRRKIIIGTIVFLIFVGIVYELPRTEVLWVEILIRGLCFVFLIHMIRVSRKLSELSAIYYGMWGVMSWQLLHEVGELVEGIANMAWDNNPLFGCIGKAMVFLIGYLIIAATIGKWMPDGGQRKIGPRQITAAALTFTVFVFLAFLLGNDGIKQGDVRWIIVYLCQLHLAVILYLESEVFKKSAMRQELEVMNLLWKKEQEQYMLSKENIALINQKCHDLKHQIRAIRDLSEGEMDKYLTEMEDSIHIYESIVKTGNEALDTILTEKSLYCKEHGITVSCVADGSQMGFINLVDLYTILGNAIDNAIEAVEKFKHQEKRQIDILIYRQQNFLAINVINPIKGNLVYEEELPVTTKKEVGYHGYGLKSVKYLIKKYDGFLSINEEDGCFSLMMLIPIPN